VRLEPHAVRHLLSTHEALMLSGRSLCLVGGAVADPQTGRTSYGASRGLFAGNPSASKGERPILTSLWNATRFSAMLFSFLGTRLARLARSDRRSVTRWVIWITDSVSRPQVVGWGWRQATSAGANRTRHPIAGSTRIFR
jgi:hypothetical protein